MRDAFPEYYLLSPAEERACILGGTIVLDTNVLFALYRFATAEREGLLRVLDQVQERLWVPHQVALEYQRARESVIRAQAGQYEKVVSLVSAPALENLTGALRGLALPEAVRGEAEALLENFVVAASEAAQPFVASANALVANHVVTQEQGRRDDPVRSRLDAYLAGKVGPRPDDPTRTERIKDALVRYEKEIPPGYKDAKKDSPDLQAGDYLLWRELLDHAATLTPADSVLFVTGDVKADWFTKDGDALPALRREFAEHSPATYHQVSYQDFLNLANEHLDSQIPTDTINRVAHIQPKNWGVHHHNLALTQDNAKAHFDAHWHSHQMRVLPYNAEALSPDERKWVVDALLQRYGDVPLSSISESMQESGREFVQQVLEDRENEIDAARAKQDNLNRHTDSDDDN